MHASIRFSYAVMAVALACCQYSDVLAFSFRSGKVSNTKFRTSSQSSRLILRDSSATSVEKASAASGSGNDDENEWRAIVSSFKMYKAAYGDLKVPSRFVVPSMPPWPEPGWGLKLGTKVAAIRSTGKFLEGEQADERRQLLDDMGFLWRLRSPSPDKKMDGVKFEQIYDALSLYKQKYGDLEVPASFVIPVTDDENNDWPEHTRGLPLGGKLSTIRSK